jgi:hypothetical protein
MTIPGKGAFDHGTYAIFSKYMGRKRYPNMGFVGYTDLEH